MTYMRYAPSVETIGNDEAETFAKIADTFAAMGRKVAEQEGRAVRVSHAKATGLLSGELVIDAGLPQELAQGIAAAPERYEALIRFAQGPGELLDDRISTHRGMAVKMLGVEGAKIPESSEPSSQDFVFEAESNAFINSNAKTFLAALRAGVANAPAMSEGVKNAASKLARAAEATMEAVGLKSKTLGFFGHPPRHPLAETYYSQVPMRWGDHVAKAAFFPTQATIDGLATIDVDTSEDRDAFRDAMIAHFASRGAEFELRVQLAVDPDINPIEDAAREWPEADNPYRRAARLVIAPQPAWSADRDAYFAGQELSRGG